MRRRRFRLIEHTADAGIIAYGDNLAEAFGNAAYGLFSIISEMKKVRAVESRQVEAAADDIDGLLFEWLNILIYTFDVEAILFKRFDICEFNERELKAVCYGERYDPARHQLRTGVKAATYHLLKVDKENNQVQVIFDV
ncbi:archease [Chloroflexota bacterium]